MFAVILGVVEALAPNVMVMTQTSRRAVVRRTVFGAATVVGLGSASSSPPVCAASGGTDVDWRRYTALAPLGPTIVARREQAKLSHLDLDEAAHQLIQAATEGATGRGGYLVTGDIDARLFQDTCRFVDPTNDVASLARYTTALNLLFDADATRQTVSLVGDGPVVDRDARTITATLHVDEGVLKLPWRPRIRAFDTNITWTVGDDGLVAEQNQVWSISAADALLQTFTPSGLF